MPQSPNEDKEPVTGADLRGDRDYFGQLTQKSWSCITLDTADKLVKFAGKPGLELYYRMSQQVEAYSTGFEGAEEAALRRILNEQYVQRSLDEYRALFPRIEAPFKLP